MKRTRSQVDGESQDAEDKAASLVSKKCAGTIPERQKQRRIRVGESLVLLDTGPTTEKRFKDPVYRQPAKTCLLS
jgi:hypothetical protein